MVIIKEETLGRCQGASKTPIERKFYIKTELEHQNQVLST